MKLHLVLVFVFSSVLMAAPAPYLGDVKDAVVKGTAGCEQIFAPGTYETKHFLTGPGGYTSVVSFKSPSGTGFLNGVTLLGQYGGHGDFEISRKFQRGDVLYEVLANGIVDSRLLIMELGAMAKKVGADGTVGEVFCNARARYDGFVAK